MMSIQSVVPNPELRHSPIPLRQDASIQPQRSLGLVSFAVLLSLSLTMLILSVMTIARMSAIPKLPDLPQGYLPGSPRPMNISCYYVPIDAQVPRCYVDFEDHKIYFVVDEATKIIIRSTIRTQAYTLGMLVASWGTPTGITWKDTVIYVYWGTRSALIYTRSLKPTSTVEFILYDLEEQPTTSPWRGFRRR
jgi:hypothetical protein